MLTDRRIIEIWDDIPGQEDQQSRAVVLAFARAIEATARAEQHAECVRLLLEKVKLEGFSGSWVEAAKLLESQKPEASK